MFWRLIIVCGSKKTFDARTIKSNDSIEKWISFHFVFFVCRNSHFFFVLSIVRKESSCDRKKWKYFFIVLASQVMSRVHQISLFIQKHVISAKIWIEKSNHSNRIISSSRTIFFPLAIACSITAISDAIKPYCVNLKCTLAFVSHTNLVWFVLLV